jgi:uncharacterized protein
MRIVALSCWGASFLFGAAIGILMGAISAEEPTSGLFASLMPANELRVFAHGSWLEQLVLRLSFFSEFVISAFVYLPWMLPLFLFGIQLAKHGVLTDPEGSAVFRRKVLLASLGIGLPLNLLALLSIWTGDTYQLSLYAEMIWGPVLGVGYFFLLVRWAESRSRLWLQETLSKIGRLAFSNYILQTVLCTTIFYSWGLGFFGRLSRLELLGVAVCVLIVNAVFSQLWLRWFSLGPLEWLWRSLTESRRIPIRAR